MGAYQLLDTSLYFTADLKEYLDNSPNWVKASRFSVSGQTFWEYSLGRVDDHEVELVLLALPQSRTLQPIELELTNWGGTTPVAFVQEAAKIMRVVQALSSLDCTDCGGYGTVASVRKGDDPPLICRTCKGTGKKNELISELKSKSAA